MTCEKWGRLLERYRSAVNAYSEAVKHLGVLPGSAFNETWSRAERARAKCDFRRADLLSHEHEHACLEFAHWDGNDPVSEISEENLVLGDQGQPGG